VGQVVPGQFEGALTAQVGLHFRAERREAVGQLEQVKVTPRRLNRIKPGKVLVVLIKAAD